MKLSDLKFNHAIYPRGLAEARNNPLPDGSPDMNRVAPDTENVEGIYDALIQNHIQHRIIYNTKTHDMIDGTHLWVAMSRIISAAREHIIPGIPKHLPELKYEEVPERYLEKITIPPEEEMLYAVHYNFAHGLKLGRDDMKAVLASYMDEAGNLKYGLRGKIAELWGMSENTLKHWLSDIRHGPREFESGSTGPNSSDINIVDKEKERLETELEETKTELARVREDARETFMKMLCKRHAQEIIRCAECGK